MLRSTYGALIVMVGVLLIGIVLVVLFNGVERNENLEHAPLTNDMVTLTGRVTEVNLEQMMVDGPGLVTFVTDAGEVHTVAVPSMGRLLCAAASTVVEASVIEVDDRIAVSGQEDEEGRIVPCEDASHYLRVTSAYTEEVYGFSFVYEKGPQGYVLEEGAMPEDAHPDLRYMVVLTEAASFDASPEPGEAPPTLQVRVYENVGDVSAAAWVSGNPEESGVTRAFADPEDVVISGADAVHYVADGLYPHDTYVIAHDGYIYALVGMYIDTDSELHRDYAELVASFSFVPGGE